VLDLSKQIGETIAHINGDGPGRLLYCNGTSINVFKLLSTALALCPDRKIYLVGKRFPHGSVHGRRFGATHR